MKIKNGYNKKEVSIKINHNYERIGELWIEFKQKNPPSETLSYITLEELKELKKEIQEVINKMEIGV